MYETKTVLCAEMGNRRKLARRRSIKPRLCNKTRVFPLVQTIAVFHRAIQPLDRANDAFNPTVAVIQE